MFVTCAVRPLVATYSHGCGTTSRRGRDLDWVDNVLYKQGRRRDVCTVNDYRKMVHRLEYRVNRLERELKSVHEACHEALEVLGGLTPP
jgi:hypothetical protein